MSTEQVLQSDAPLDLRLSEAELEATAEHLSAFVADVVDDAGAEGAVIGLSGGIDSTTVAYLAVDALGPDAVHGLVMPSVANSEENMSDAEWVAEELGIEYDVVEIQPIAERFSTRSPTPPTTGWPPATSTSAPGRS